MSRGARDKSERFLSHLDPVQQALSAYCLRALNDSNEVPDVLQSAVANAYRNFDLYAEGTNFRAWMFRYVSYEVLNRNRAASRHRTDELGSDVVASVDGTEIPESAMSRLLEEPERVLDHVDESLAKAVLELPETERSIFLLRAMGEFKYREIAEILDVPVGTVMGLLSRSRDRLRRRLAEYGQTHGLLPGRDSE
ncbi:MAG: RNA polymerase sigma factor [Planctomycetaceae bacterium]